MGQRHNAAIVAFSLPGALILSLTMGFVFGRWVGTILVVVAATAQASLQEDRAIHAGGSVAARVDISAAGEERAAERQGRRDGGPARHGQRPARRAPESCGL